MQALINRLYGYDTDIADKTFTNRAIQELTDEGVYGYQNLIAAYSGVAGQINESDSERGNRSRNKLRKIHLEIQAESRQQREHGIRKTD